MDMRKVGVQKNQILDFLRLRTGRSLSRFWFGRLGLRTPPTNSQLSALSTNTDDLFEETENPMLPLSTVY
jgi:hypothetical protein